MYLREIKIERERFGENKGQYTGRAQFENELGLVALNLTPEMCNDIFKVCSEGIITTAKQAAEEMTCSVIEHKAQIENEQIKAGLND